jgi:benzoyl-CoA reductase/2-hydroxyglutaryl-CoA dehydratase subunit BcrC/BadD/HgdB
MKPLSTVAGLVEAAAGPYEFATSYKKETGRRIAGSACSWVPAEILDAMETSLFRVPLHAGRISHAASHLQSYGCSAAKGILELGLNGKLDFLDVMIFPNLCDTLQNLVDIWLHAMSRIPAAGLYVPVNLDSSGACSYLETELERFAAALSGILKVRPGDDGLERAIDTRARRRRAILDLFERRAKSPRAVTAVDMYGFLWASDFLETGELETMAASLGGSGDASAGRGGVQVFLAGTGFPYPSFFRLLDELSIRVADDYICQGRAFFGYGPDPESDGSGRPMRRIARSLLSRVDGAVKFREGAAGRLEERILKSGAGEVLWVTQKFCDPWGWQLGILKERLEKAGLRVFPLEITGVEGEDAALRTRLEAFVEMVEMGGDFY